MIQIKNDEMIKDSSHHARALVLDDDPAICKMLSKLLLRLKFDVVCTFQGKQAMDEYKKAKSLAEGFDVVILDLIIPGDMGGEEAFQHIFEFDPKVRAIVSSGYSKNPIMSNYQNYGFRAALPKPYNFSELREVIEEIMQVS
ncbi:hypothetical protein NEF87_000169 [Candidatus Lokiarchaeum ossiferum]|uniref:Response regulatory domain-containing protein n=1 Tax=Candidatus Lokiarchaeum ossiferum TaxID=2951803 RepID=A0ABY6HK34_9ARCH|nr:hypothetical protein NEF87_000169 [Candidatus Lokiarchaeum sp. B-35]